MGIEKMAVFQEIGLDDALLLVCGLAALIDKV